MPKTLSNLLISRTDRLGDVLLTLPVLEEIKKSFPATECTFLCTDYTKPIVELYGRCDNVITMPDGGLILGRFIKLIKLLRKLKFDAVVAVYPRFFIALACFVAGIPLRIGTSRRWYSLLFNRRIRLSRRHSNIHEAELNFQLLGGLGLPVSETVTPPTFYISEAIKKRVHSILSDVGVESQGKLAVLHPGSGGSATEWEPERYGLLGSLLTEKGWVVLFTGTAREREIIKKCLSVTKRGIDLSGKLDLNQLAALFSVSDVMVACSTGPLHLASLIGCPVVGLYPVKKGINPIRWGPLGKCHITLVSESDEGMKDITPLDVLAAIDKVTNLEKSRN